MKVDQLLARFAEDLENDTTSLDQHWLSEQHLAYGERTEFTQTVAIILRGFINSNHGARLAILIEGAGKTSSSAYQMLRLTKLSRMSQQSKRNGGKNGSPTA